MKSFFEQYRIHHFDSKVSLTDLPEKFTNPFDYVPHRLCYEAFSKVKKYLLLKEEWSREIADGKMFGVLVVRCYGEIGFLAAFSGTLADSSSHEYFVLPVFDFLGRESYFRREEKKIVEINRQIEALGNDAALLSSLHELEFRKQQILDEVKDYESFVKASKSVRNEKRKNDCSENELQNMVRESQFQKAELRRRRQKANTEIETIDKQIAILKCPVDELRKKRKCMSNDLQDWLFQNFCFLNAKGETRSLYDIFIKDNGRIPPSGSGECCAPRLLQWAYVNHLQPVCMAEFWLGKSPVGEIRIENNYYPACKNKCEPILGFMLKGMEIEDTRRKVEGSSSLPILYEDEHIVAINKPSGLLSVPGKNGEPSSQDILSSQLGNPDLKAIHRLDMATSGILLFSKTKDDYKLFQSLFAGRNMHKTYVAVLSGVPEQQSGVIRLPLCSDYNHRPCQMVSFEHGKSSVTNYEVISVEQGRARVHFYPETGRTHQLRVHSAHSLGLGLPIVGDSLYGTSADRLLLHAERLEFVHPYTQKMVVIECPSEF